ncbi:MAG: hypothetical protein H6739_04790 [Alphaproteobacteria bacterium]|nr:hypothetical protein [Alphaproteobacteria bacterium]
MRLTLDQILARMRERNPELSEPELRAFVERHAEVLDRQLRLAQARATGPRPRSREEDVALGEALTGALRRWTERFGVGYPEGRQARELAEVLRSRRYGAWGPLSEARLEEERIRAEELLDDLRLGLGERQSETPSLRWPALQAPLLGLEAAMREAGMVALRPSWSMQTLFRQQLERPGSPIPGDLRPPVESGDLAWIVRHDLHRLVAEVFVDLNTWVGEVAADAVLELVERVGPVEQAAFAVLRAGPETDWIDLLPELDEELPVAARGAGAEHVEQSEETVWVVAFPEGEVLVDTEDGVLFLTESFDLDADDDPTRPVVHQPLVGLPPFTRLSAQNLAFLRWRAHRQALGQPHT